MATSLSPNTQAILLLTAPLIVGRAPRTSDLLKPSEYNRLARRLRELDKQPADLLGKDAPNLFTECSAIVEEARLGRLLGRGMLLTQAIEQWQKRAIWVISRADADYPQRLKSRLQEKAPAVLYGCGNKTLLAGGGLAVVGSRNVDENLVDYTLSIGGLASQARKTVVSGGAKGIDQAAMRGALETGGCAIGVLADSLERAAMNRDNRALLLDERLVLVSPFDPRAGFNAGNAMQRNKFIYALADAALVVNSDKGKGGTWAGAIEQLDKLHFVTLYFRSTGDRPAAFDALQKKGALPWPNPGDAESLDRALTIAPSIAADGPKSQDSLFSANQRGAAAQSAPTAGPEHAAESIEVPLNQTVTDWVADAVQVDSLSALIQQGSAAKANPADARPPSSPAPAEVVFNGARTAMRELLTVPMKGEEIAKVLEVSTAQANAWLKRLVAEGSVQKIGRPPRYLARQQNLFDQRS